MATSEEFNMLGNSRDMITMTEWLALQLKLDELIRVNKAARNSLVSLEKCSESKVEELKSAFDELSSAGSPPALSRR